MCCTPSAAGCLCTQTLGPVMLACWVPAHAGVAPGPLQGCCAAALRPGRVLPGGLALLPGAQVPSSRRPAVVARAPFAPACARGRPAAQRVQAIQQRCQAQHAGQLQRRRARPAQRQSPTFGIRLLERAVGMSAATSMRGSCWPDAAGQMQQGCGTRGASRMRP